MTHTRAAAGSEMGVCRHQRLPHKTIVIVGDIQPVEVAARTLAIELSELQSAGGRLGPAAAGDRRHLPGAVRASAGINTTADDIDRFLSAVAAIAAGQP